MSQPRLLVVDDDRTSGDVVAEALRAQGYLVATAQRGQAALALVKERVFDAIVADIHLPDLDGSELLRKLQECSLDSKVILMTAVCSVEAALEAFKAGAYDYVSKSVHLEDLVRTVRQAIKQQRLVHESQLIPQPIHNRSQPGHIVGVSPRMLDVFKLIARMAPNKSTVLITGESGTGKEVVARALHANGPRASGPFVTIDCGGLAESILESELFGHVRGAFTGAIAARRGLFESAQGGTVFLDEIGDISPNIQAKLLRVLDLQEVKPVGGNDSIRIDVRLIAATHKDLRIEFRAGRFREDLFYRLNVVCIQLPPLRERREDIPVLANHFLRKYCAANGKALSGIAAEAMACLEAYAWPGNVRELENAIERAVAFSRNPVLITDDLPIQISSPDVTTGIGTPDIGDPRSLEDLIRRHIERVLNSTGGNKKRTAEILGVDRKTLYRMIERYTAHIP